MPCDVEILKEVPFFSLLDDDELKVLAAQVEMRTFAPRQRIYRIGEASGRAYVLVSGAVDVTTIDEDHQDVIFDQPARGQFFGFASLLDQTPHQTNATAIEPTICIEIDRHDIATLVQQRPHAALDMFVILGQQMHAAQHLIRGRAARNPNEMIEAEATIGDRVADTVAAFGGSWTFIISFALTLVVYTALNVALRGRAWDPYPFILLNLFLSMLAAVQAPVIMMSQNRQDAKDRLRGELDYEVNRRSETQIQGLARKMNLLIDKVDDLEEALKRT